MDVYLVRHAKAGSRSSYHGPDDSRRPLSGKGRAQAEALVARFADVKIGGLLSSPYTRCVETIEPLAAAHGLTVDTTASLAEGAGPAGVLALVESADAPLVLCTHGDIVGDVVTLLDRRGVRVRGDGLEKASVWVLTVEDGEIVGARYEAPPT